MYIAYPLHKLNNNNKKMPDTPEEIIQRVGIKYTPFWRANPTIWFIQLESQFTLANITASITKYHHLVASLQPEELAIVGDIISSPPADDPYAALKARLVNQYAVSEDSRLRELVSGMQLGDKKPSRLLLEMRSKAGAQVGDDLLKTLFIQRLPAHVQQILAISDDKLDKLAEMADGIMAATGPPAFIQNVQNDDSLKSLIMDISARLQRLETRDLANETENFGFPPKKHFRTRSRSRSRHTSKSDSRLCWYHDTFGEKANKCKAPCSWTGN